jgi:uncharacterized OsmC-like protein
MTTTQSALNQVDADAVAALVKSVQDRPEEGLTKWAAEVRWTGAFASAAHVRDFEPVPSDEPAGLGGGDTAPNPAEQLLGALGNCLAVGYAANATAAGIAIRDLRINVEGDIDLHAFLGLKDGHAGFSGIRAAVHLDSDADPEAVAALHRRVASGSPIGHTLKAAVPVEITPA